MIRKAFIMTVHAGHEAEYQQRHQPIWPELEQVLRDHGVHSYSIFFDSHSRNLFAYAEIANEAQWAAIATTDVCQRWWKSMRHLMPTNNDHSPLSTPLNEIFHLE
jgi:L-rhamnose mutarotase